MLTKNAVAFVLNVSLPFARERKPAFSFQEMPVFESINDTFIPLLAMIDRLDAAQIPFRLSLVLPPVVCDLLSDPRLIERYLRYVDMKIAFGKEEISRRQGKIQELARYYYDDAIEKRALFTERYQKNILDVLLVHQQRGKIEFLGTAASSAFLPFYSSEPVAINVQLSVARQAEQRYFQTKCEGFWLPELGYVETLDEPLLAHGYDWTIVDSHTALLTSPPPERGVFYPLLSNAGIVLLARDYFACDELSSLSGDHPFNDAFRSHFADVGHELPLTDIQQFLTSNGTRIATGYRYQRVDGARDVYDLQRGMAAAKEKARQFIAKRAESLGKAEALMGVSALSVCACDADQFGRFWYEGFTFLEEVFRLGAKHDQFIFMTPSEYLSKHDRESFQTVQAGFSSQSPGGYGQAYLDASNDWGYRHILRSIERMTELAERFEYEGGMWERALNQAVRELILAQSSSWTRLMSSASQHEAHEWAEYGREQLEKHIRNFTTFYESLGSDYLSTRFLTELERNHHVFADINYRIFRRHH